VSVFILGNGYVFTGPKKHSRSMAGGTQGPTIQHSKGKFSKNRSGGV